MSVLRFLVVILSAVLVLTGCGVAAPGTNTADPIAGDYILRGGGGALDAVTALTRAFKQVHPDVNFQGLEDVGSDAAIRLAASGEADLGFISRDLRPAEVGMVKTLSIGHSGTALAVNVNSFVRGLTKDQLAGIYTGKITDWSEVGGVSGKIRVLAREQGSAVRSGFESYVFGGMKPTYTKNLVILNDANQTIDAITSFTDAIGMLSMSKQAFAAAGIRMLAIDGVPATKTTVADGTYKILRNLYLVYNPDPAKVKPGIKEFLKFVQGDAGQEVLSGL